MSRDNPWKTVGTRLVYENAWIRLREDRVIGPDGRNVPYGVIECNLAVGVVALAPGDEVVLVGQYRYPVSAYSWEIVEGGTADGEDPLAAAQRELAEEAGLRARTWRKLGGPVYVANAHSTEGARIWLATDLEETASSPDPTEILALERVPLATCVQRVLDGDITDAVSIIGILRAHHLTARSSVAAAPR